MKLARMLYPVTVLGPGKRIAVWLSGCRRACKGCANPELWEATDEQEVALSDVYRMIAYLYEKSEGQVDGFTITGGEPFEQSEELLKLLTYMQNYSQDILLFTGYQKQELMQDERCAAVLDKLAVLVDGPYVEEKNAGELLRGSTNQTIHYRDEQVQKAYQSYIQSYEGISPVENFTVSDGVISVGIHRKDFKEALTEGLFKKDIMKCEGGKKHE